MKAEEPPQQTHPSAPSDVREDRDGALVRRNDDRDGSASQRARG